MQSSEFIISLYFESNSEKNSKYPKILVSSPINLFLSVKKFDLKYDWNWKIWTRSLRWNYQNLILLIQSKLMIKKLPNISKFPRYWKANNLQTIEDIDHKFYRYNFKSRYTVVSKFHILIINIFRDISS